MIVHSSGSLLSLISSVPFKLGVSAIPGNKEKAASVPGGGHIYLTTGADRAEKATALKFVKFISTPEREMEFSKATGYIILRLY